MKEGVFFIFANNSKMRAMEIRCHHQDRFLSAVLKFDSVV